MTSMRDGIALACDLYIPDAPGRYPAILERTPYGKEHATMMWTDTHTYLVERGYMVALQDTRGRYASEGTWYPFRDEAEDGHDTVEWLVQHPACNGAVGTFGGSYSGSTQYLLAPTRPRGLKCMFVREAPSDLAQEWVYRGGVFELGFNLHWAIHQSPAALSNRIRQFTRASIPGVFEEGWSPLFENPFQWLADWTAGVVEHQVSAVGADVPILHLGGWYDIFLHGTLANYEQTGGKLMIGPWRHGPPMDETFMRQVGELDFGPAAVINFNETVGRWFDRHLKGVDAPEPRVSIFRMGANDWRNMDAWPPPDVRYCNYYLRRDGALLPQAPDSSETPDTYQHDPPHPVPAIGGATLYTLPGTGAVEQSNIAKLGLQAGPRDQRPIEKLTYTTPVLENDLEVTGPVLARLYVSSDAASADFVVRLTDVWPDGRSILIADGIQRVKLTPGRVEPVTVDLWATSNVFLKGHRIRVGIAGSSFPRFESNPNKSVNSIHHSSYIVLPLV